MTVLAATAAAAAGLVLAPGDALASSGARITQGVDVTKFDVTPARAYSAPFVLVDPHNPLNIVEATVEMRSQVCRVFRSTDGGLKWQVMDNLPAPPTYPLCFNPSGSVTETPLAWGRNDTLYLAMDGWAPQDGGNTSGNLSIIVSKSTNFGRTWSAVVARNNRGKTGTSIETDRPISGIAVDSSGKQDVVYVTYRHNQPGLPTRAYVIVSKDGGDTWGTPVDIAAPFINTPGNIADLPTANYVPNDATGFNPEVQVDNKGNAYVMWEQRTSGVTPAPNYAYYITKSSNEGATWTTVPAYPSTPELAGGQFIWSPYGGPQGTLAAVWHGEPGETQGNTDIYFRSSTDGGQTWSNPVRLNDDNPADLNIHLLPAIAVAPNGRLDVAWWDFRNDTGVFANDVYYTYSTNDGATWAANIRITDKSINRTFGPWGNGFDMRQPVGLGSTNNFVVFGYDDTVNGNAQNQNQDIYSSVYQFHPVPASGPSGVTYVLAAVIGVGAVGLILLVVGRTRRRGPEEPVSTPPTPVSA
ncbi:MAG: sialidase family protein, partial [Acidimicrobiales bacterium]